MISPEWLAELDNSVALARAAEARADKETATPGERYGETVELWRIKERLWELWPQIRAALKGSP